MKTYYIMSPIRDALNHSALAVTAAIGLAMTGSLVGTAQAADDFLTPIDGTSQSYYSGDDRAPIHAIDGTGMTPNNPVTASSTCGNNPGQNMWLSNGHKDAWMTFDLGSEQTITGFHLWNYSHVTATISAPALGGKLFGRLMATEN